MVLHGNPRRPESPKPMPSSVLIQLPLTSSKQLDELVVLRVVEGLVRGLDPPGAIR